VPPAPVLPAPAGRMVAFDLPLPCVDSPRPLCRSPVEYRRGDPRSRQRDDPPQPMQRPSAASLPQSAEHAGAL